MFEYQKLKTWWVHISRCEEHKTKRGSPFDNKPSTDTCGGGGWRVLGDFLAAQKPFVCLKEALQQTPNFRHARYCK